MKFVQIKRREDLKFSRKKEEEEGTTGGSDILL